MVDHHITARRPAELVQAVDEGQAKRLVLGIAFVLREQHGDPPHPLLRTRRQRPNRRRATRQSDEFAPSHSYGGQPTI